MALLESVGYSLSGGTQKLFTVPKNHRAYLRRMLVANHDTSSRKIDIEWQNGVSIFIIKNKLVPGEDYLSFDDVHPLVMYPDDYLQIITPTGNMSVTVTFELIPLSGVNVSFKV